VLRFLASYERYQGRRELQAQDLALEPIRGRGGGRPPVEKKRPR
jgi:hypothetical protein